METDGGAIATATIGRRGKCQINLSLACLCAPGHVNQVTHLTNEQRTNARLQINVQIEFYQ